MKLTISQVNEPWNDNVLFVENNVSNEAWLLDCGDLHRLSLRDLMRVRRVFISHTHIDHFIGVDTWVRMNLLESRELFIYGPENFTVQLAHKLQGYAWDLEERFGLAIIAYEIRSDKVIVTRMQCSDGFLPHQIEERPNEGFLELSMGCKLRFASAIHREHAPCLAYILEEPVDRHVDINAIKGLGFTPGPWIRDLKERFSAGDMEGTINIDGQDHSIADLAARCVSEKPGQRYAYITDSIFNKVSVKNFRSMGVGVAEMWGEACYYDRLDAARSYCHFTVRQTARLATEMQAEKLFLLHLSRRLGTQHHLEQHLEAARAVFPNTCEPRMYKSQK